MITLNSMCPEGKNRHHLIYAEDEINMSQALLGRQPGLQTEAGDLLLCSAGAIAGINI